MTGIFSRGGGMVDTRALRAREGKIFVRVRVSPSAPRSVAQLVARRVWDAEVPGSSPGTPTQRGFFGMLQPIYWRLFLIFKTTSSIEMFGLRM